MDSLVGILYKDWKTLLKENRYRISAPYLMKSLLITALSLRNNVFYKQEVRQYEEKFKNIQLSSPPVFILGHWRSGTTFLHNLLSRDQQFAYPRLFEIRNPSTFLYIAQRFDKMIQASRDAKRPMDNVMVSRLSPGEEEFALCVTTLMSPLLGWVFPKNVEYYNRFITFEDVEEAKVNLWKEHYFTFLKKLTFRYNKPLLLKNPLNTARIPIILSMFPDAKIIHIHRNPVDVFHSTRKLTHTAVRTSNMQTAPPETDQLIIHRYKVTYDTYFRSVNTIPKDNFIDVAFEDLEVKPVHIIESIYDNLNIDGFSTMKPRLEEYLGSVKNYKKNTYTPLPAQTNDLLRSEWKQSFDTWNYKD